MRLSSQQCAKIREIVERIAGSGVGIFVFGSRVDDAQRGGDVDLILETSGHLDLRQASRITAQLETSLQLPFDVVAVTRGCVLTPFQTMARARASLLP
jgi:predicted nucleotidyltransferase